MLTRLDHFVLVCPDIDAGVLVYTVLLGRKPSWRTSGLSGGAQTAIFKLENTALELMAPVGGGLIAEKLREMLKGSQDGLLTSLAFETDDIKTAHHTLMRRGLRPSDIALGNSQDKDTEQTRQWQRFRCPDEVCAGIKTFILEHSSRPLHMSSKQGGSATSLDHIVIHTPNPERAIAHYGARLGLRFALDRTAEAFGARFLFFQVGGLTLELIHRLDQEHDVDDADSFWGLTWKVDDLVVAHSRLSAAGIDISDIRTGRKPGTQVFTVRSGTLGVPTLFLEHQGQANV